MFSQRDGGMVEPFSPTGIYLISHDWFNIFQFNRSDSTRETGEKDQAQNAFCKGIKKLLDQADEGMNESYMFLGTEF